MQIQDIRRAKLREWFSARSIPPKEKSYISQLLKDGNPFGERAARRLEDTYGMGAMFLDTAEGEDPPKRPATERTTQSRQSADPSHSDPLAQAMHLLELFYGADERGRTDILRLAETLSRSSQHQAGSNER